jgi:hypothetical protein
MAPADEFLSSVIIQGWWRMNGIDYDGTSNHDRISSLF